ncbi:MAG: beta-galactosidase [Clostridia bacterium]|nr:beta-galactosidase [Clostridia bacterium]
MHFGVDYYPEHWPEDRWAEDIRLMKQANFNIVRLAEFAWTKMEPVENEYHFEWLDKIISLFEESNIKVVLCTPTATPPKWLMDKYPDIYPIDEYGHVRGYGSRRHYCFNNETYKEYTKKIVKAMANHYKNNKTVVTWQLDNEFGCHNTVRCYCDDCEKAFQKYLENKYETIENLNEKLGMAFWSQTYYSFESVIIPRHTVCDYKEGKMLAHNPGLWLDYCRFASQSVDDYAALQIEVLRENGVTVPITHNFMAKFYDIDYNKHAKLYDFVSWDCYPNIVHGPFDDIMEVSFQHDMMRGYKNRKFWIMEMSSGPGGWNFMGRAPDPAQLRLWTYQAVAHGADGILYFRWRPCLFGTEQYWHGILDHDGIGRDRYKIIKQVGAEFKTLESIIDRTENVSEVCMIRSFDNVWSHDYQWHSQGFDYNQILSYMHIALSKLNINCDVTDFSHDLSKYKLVIIPAYNISTAENAEMLRKYVKNGGNALITFRSGNRDEYNKINGLTIPGYFRELAGIDVINYDALGKDMIKIKGVTGDSLAAVWADIIDQKDCEVLAAYDDCFYKNSPCITKNSVGKGTVYYMGCHTDVDTYQKVLKVITENIQTTKLVDKAVEGVETVYREYGDKKALFVLNYNDYNVSINILVPVKKTVHLEAFGVTVIY